MWDVFQPPFGSLRDAARYTTGSIWNSADGLLGKFDLPPLNFCSSVLLTPYYSDPQKLSVKSGNNTSEFSQLLLGSYFELAHRGDGVSADLKAYIRAYLTVQYDALANRAQFASGTSNFYGVGLRPARQLDPEAQIVAITTLLGGVISWDDDYGATPNDPGGPGTRDTGNPKYRAPIGAIVGGVVGGVLGLGFVVTGICCFYFRRIRRQSHIVEPYPAAMLMNSPESTMPSQTSGYKTRASPACPGISSAATTPVSSAPEPQSSRTRETTTGELVGILYRRLRDGRWDGNERLPEYHRSTLIS
ncbi:hypothetical protein PQX77_022382 [Marasmius sp. AFHP31]|nr:hypothetical protein PQX77_022382 [Marasmius sp. AFHP31]